MNLGQALEIFQIPKLRTIRLLLGMQLTLAAHLITDEPSCLAWGSQPFV